MAPIEPVQPIELLPGQIVISDPDGLLTLKPQKMKEVETMPITFVVSLTEHSGDESNNG